MGLLRPQAAWRHPGLPSTSPECLGSCLETTLGRSAASSSEKGSCVTWDTPPATLWAVSLPHWDPLAWHRGRLDAF